VPEYIKALVVILVLSTSIFWIARRQVCDQAIKKTDFDQRRNLWIGITIASFLAQNFWIYIALSSLMIIYVSRREKNSIALFLFVAFAVPPMAVTIPGIGGVQQIFSVSHVRLLVILILLPAYIRLRRDPESLAFGKSTADKFLLGYIVLPLVLQLNVDTLTNTIRFGLYSIVDVFLPYYVASRGLRTIVAWRDAAMSMMVAIAILTVIGIFEYNRKWLLYGSVPTQLGVDWDFGTFILRGETLRAMASSGHAIVLGYLLMIGFALYASSKDLITSKKFQFIFGAAIVLGLLGSGARGPWVGAFIIILVLLVTGKDVTKRAMLLAIGIGVLVSLLMMTTRGSEFLDYLPFVGTTNSESVVYRQRLFDVSLQIVSLNPILGSFDYMRNPLMQQMIQGEGIIDVVNTYLGIALTYGLLGLGTFVGVFVSCGFVIWQGMKHSVKGGELYNIGRSLFATLAAILVAIATCSSVTYVALLYWIVAGLCIGYKELVALKQEEVDRILVTVGGGKTSIYKHGI
jgi:O-antigen ligase